MYHLVYKVISYLFSYLILELPKRYVLLFLGLLTLLSQMRKLRLNELPCDLPKVIWPVSGRTSSSNLWPFPEALLTLDKKPQAITS